MTICCTKLGTLHTFLGRRATTLPCVGPREGVKNGRKRNDRVETANEGFPPRGCGVACYGVQKGGSLASD
ncbi:hypothetical protein ZHAS_00021451 [Anopheles sinensis]|uniref:Uncharacterized protein n=1 Tax=Anopheles sinensis TaxID=74873 RepID=A0A084WSF8_ANOSI|nr:hypothetical protein ZHAS_00021451 [Anopheles sinensis]